MSRPRAASNGLLAATAIAGLCLTAGCSWVPWRKVPLDTAAGFYQSASLVYRLDAGKLQQPLDVIRVEGQSVAFEQVASSPLPDESIGALSLVFPHPGGKANLAQARFTIDSVPAAAKTAQPAGWNPFGKKPDPAKAMVNLSSSQPEVHEVWVLDIPSSESDQVFKLLSSQNFFNTERPQHAGVRLSVKMNGTEVQKDWDEVPELNALAQRVRREGQLVSFTRPGALSGQEIHAISSPRVYGQLMEQTAQVGGPAASFASSAFAVAPPSATSRPAAATSRPASSAPQLPAASVAQGPPAGSDFPAITRR
jgi:hypothetical protein